MTTKPSWFASTWSFEERGVWIIAMRPCRGILRKLRYLVALTGKRSVAISRRGDIVAYCSPDGHGPQRTEVGLGMSRRHTHAVRHLSPKSGVP
jgi:hypothetical protein